MRDRAKWLDLEIFESVMTADGFLDGPEEYVLKADKFRPTEFSARDSRSSC